VKEDKFTPMVVVVGNKMDRCGAGERRVSSEDASSAAVELNWNHSVLEASAKDNANVAEEFWELLRTK